MRHDRHWGHYVSNQKHPYTNDRVHSGLCLPSHTHLQLPLDLRLYCLHYRQRYQVLHKGKATAWYAEALAKRKHQAAVGRLPYIASTTCMSSPGKGAEWWQWVGGKMDRLWHFTPRGICSLARPCLEVRHGTSSGKLACVDAPLPSPAMLPCLSPLSACQPPPGGHRGGSGCSPALPSAWREWHLQ